MSNRNQQRRLALISGTLATVVIAQSSIAASIKSITTSEGNSHKLVSMQIKDESSDTPARIIEESKLIRAKIIDSVTDAKGEGIDLISGNPHNDGGEFALPEGMSIPAAGQRASVINTDSLLTTGIPNITQMEVEFNQPVKNLPGADIVLFDTGGPDNFSITINGKEVVLKDKWSTGLKTNVKVTVWRNEGVRSFQSLNDSSDSDQKTLERSTFARSGTYPVDINGLALDLDDFGVAANETITRMIIKGGGTLDISYIGAIQ